MEQRVLRTMHVRLSKVILLRDAFSGQAVSQGVRLCTSPQGRLARKPGGYCLFLDMRQEQFEVEIEAPIYQRRKLLLRADGGRAVEEVLLYPSQAYPAGTQVTSIQGHTKPGTSVCFHLEEESRECRLLGDYRQGETRLSLYLGEQDGISAGLWYLRDRETKAGEYVRLCRLPEPPEQWELCKPLRHSYRKKNTAAYPACSCIAGEDGGVYLLLGRLRDQTYKLYGTFPDGGETVREWEIQGLKQNTLPG